MEREREERFSVIAKRLKEAREQSGITQDEVSNLLLEKYDVSISTSSIKNYEIEHSTPGRPMRVGSMSTEVLQGLSELYGVSSDYLLGLTDIKTKDTELAAVCEYTGLDEEAVLKLSDFKEQEEMYPGVSNVLSHISNFLANANETFFDMLDEYIGQAFLATDIQKRYPNFDLTQKSFWYDMTGNGEIDIDEIKKANDSVIEILKNNHPFILFKMQKELSEFVEKYAARCVKEISFEEYMKKRREMVKQSERVVKQLEDMREHALRIEDVIPKEIREKIKKAKEKGR